MTPRPLPSGLIDWEEIYRKILHGETGYNTVQKIDRMTMAEVAMALDNDFSKIRPPPGAVAHGALGIDRWRAWWRTLSNWERLKWLKEEY